MSYEERLERLHQSGVLSGEQAARLAKSLAGKTAEVATHPRVKGWIVEIIGMTLIAVAGVAINMYLAPPSTHTINTIQDVSQALNQPEEIGQMSKTLSGGISLTLFIVVPLMIALTWFVWLYNSLASSEEEVFEAWAQVESNYQRRADLIPNILESVSKYMKFEQETLTGVVRERSEAMNVDDQTVTQFEEAVEQMTKAQSDSSALMEKIADAPESEEVIEDLYAKQVALGQSMHRILALSENYPSLRSADQMLTLEAELEGSENRINIARMRFNEAASEFNASMRRMPMSMVASLGGFQRKAYFKSDEGANKAVKVNFE